MVGFGGYEPDQLVQVVGRGCEGGVVAVGADREYQPLAVAVEQLQIA
jgi:hypothetical protein